MSTKVAKRSSKKKGVSTERKVLFGMSASLVVVIFITGCLLGFILTRDTKAEEPSPQVIIDNVDLIKNPSTPADSEEMMVDVYIDITNIGKVDVKSVTVKLTVEETDSTLGIQMKKEIITNLPVETTKDVSLTITLPEPKDYNIKIVLYVEDMLMVRGQAQIRLSPEQKMSSQPYTTTEDRTQDYGYDDDDDSDSGAGSLFSPESEEARTSSAGVVLFIGAIIVVIIIVVALAIVVSVKKSQDKAAEDQDQ